MFLIPKCLIRGWGPLGSVGLKQSENKLLRDISRTQPLRYLSTCLIVIYVDMCNTLAYISIEGNADKQHLPPCFQTFETAFLAILNRGCGTEDVTDRLYSRTGGLYSSRVRILMHQSEKHPGATIRG